MGNQTKKIFLSAEWRNLLLFSYSVDPKILAPLLPSDCELDLRHGSAHVSLVAFQFLNTKVLGVPWPGFTNFPEVNLRFYIRHQGERGVCFIREHVPSRLVSSVAKIIYNEPYCKAKMTHAVTITPKNIQAKYTLSDRKQNLSLYASAENNSFMPAADSSEHHFKEHELGVGKDRRGRTLTYRVHHPHWNVFPVSSYKVDVDAEALYGKKFGFLSKSKPDSVVFAEGSEILVYRKN